MPLRVGRPRSLKVQYAFEILRNLHATVKSNFITFVQHFLLLSYSRTCPVHFYVIVLKR